MTSDAADDTSVTDLHRLVALAPDPHRAERVRARCRARLGRGRPRPARVRVTTGFVRRALAAAVVGGFCVLYVTALVATTLRFYRMFR